jgi:hypothetical protein
MEGVCRSKIWIKSVIKNAGVQVKLTATQLTTSKFLALKSLFRGQRLRFQRSAYFLEL